MDDQSWTVRYVVADTGSWLVSKRVLIAPEALSEPDWAGMVFPVKITREQVENSPDVDTAMPVSREKELEYRRHFRWPAYWPAPGIGQVTHPVPLGREGVVVAERPPKAPPEKKETSSHLRSISEVKGYGIMAVDGALGHVEDFVVDDETWAVRYLVVDTRNWLPGKKVLVATDWIDWVSWEEKQVRIDLTRQQIQDAPEYDPRAPVNREYEVRLYDYYGRPMN
ncbi:MAG: PRC-barrel domain-containing protein [Bacillota bacterium]